MKSRFFLSIIIFCAVCVTVTAGEISTFVNLGFSSDSTKFMFGIHSLSDKNAYPKAEAYIVDVISNRFINKGRESFTATRPANLGQDGLGALFTVTGRLQNVIQTSGIDHGSSGRLVYILLNGDLPKSNIAFRDFNTGNAFSVELAQSTRKVQASNESEFSLKVIVTSASSQVKTFNIGRPGFYRSNVDRYKVRQIVLSPDERSLVFVIEKELDSANGHSSHYMVETVRVF